MSQPTRFSALVVNYNTGAFACACVDSLRAEWARDGRDPELLEVVVVDNASPVDQTEWLERLAAGGAEVVRSDENLGYAAGMNLAYAHTSGGPKDVVGVLNPDLYFLPGSLAAMLDYLAEHPECGAIDPKATVDHSLAMNLPRNLLPTVREHVWTVLARISPSLCRAYSRRRLDAAIPWWTSTEPIVTRMLSGCCMLLRREVVEELGRPMDERYPLYYEDSDLCRELARRGYTLVHHTGAPVLHHWSRSSGVGAEFQGDPMARYWKSQRAYYRKWSGPLGAWAVAFANGFAERWPAKWSFRPMHAIESLGQFTEPLEIRLPREGRFLMELAMAPTWLLAAGLFAEGDRWVCTPETWEWLFQADYFIRAIDLDTKECVGAWHFVKAVPGRSGPLEASELEGSAAERPGERSEVTA